MTVLRHAPLRQGAPDAFDHHRTGLGRGDQDDQPAGEGQFGRSVTVGVEASARPVGLPPVELDRHQRNGVCQVNPPDRSSGALHRPLQLTWGQRVEQLGPRQQALLPLGVLPQAFPGHLRCHGH